MQLVLKDKQLDSLIAENNEESLRVENEKLKYEIEDKENLYRKQGKKAEDYELGVFEKKIFKAFQK